jgi:hypothetical protein
MKGVAQVVRIENSMFGHGFETISIPPVIGPASNDSAGISVPLLHFPYAVRWLMPSVPNVIDRMVRFA